MFFWVYQDQAGYWRWTLYAANNRKIADGAEGYFNRLDCEHGIGLVQGTSFLTPIRYAP